MSGQEPEFPLGAPMDDDEIYVAGIEIVAFLDKDGTDSYRVRFDTMANVSTILGVIELAKYDLIARYQKNPTD